MITEDKARAVYDRKIIGDLGKTTLRPDLFVRYAFPWGKDELAEYTGPEEWQQDVLVHMADMLGSGKSLSEVIQIAVSSGHGIGKGALTSWITLWAISTMPDTRGVITANTDTQLRTKTWAELAKWHRLFIANHFFNFTATSIYSSIPANSKTWRVDMVPWSEENTEAFAGLHNKGRRILLVFDEASSISDKIWEVAEGALTDKNTQIIWCAFGNPTRNKGRFHACFNSHRHRWYHKQIDSRSVSITNKEKIKEWVEDYGEDSDFVKVRVKGQFPNSSDHQFIPYDIVEAARKRKLRPEEYNFAPVIIGVDRAWSGDDTKIYMRQGLYSHKLATFNKGEDDFVVAGHLALLEDEWKADAVFIDFGYGTGLFSAGKHMGRQWTLVNFGSDPMDKKYLNKRAEMWGLMRDWLKEGGKIDDSADLVNDLIGPEAYEVQSGKNMGRIVLESKKDMRARGLDSTDDGDGLALSFSFPVKTKSEQQFDGVIASAQREYDPFNRTENISRVYNPLSDASKIFVKPVPVSFRDMITKK